MSKDQWVWQIEETFPSRTGAGKDILNSVLEQLKVYGYADHDISSVHLALEEALVNAIKHGNQHDADKQVHVVVKLSPNLLRIEVEDEGTGFDPEGVPDPTLPENLELPSGRGLMLMRSFMSRIEFNESGNRVLMEKVRTPS
ncbi:Anti-sigma regulatory factor [Planctomycetales bacterium 10988]|nr:Anti-sigma regulatory factor [Planctomycetales bacterium 10988]